MSIESLSRRQALTGVAGVGIALPLLAACGEEDSESPGSGSAAPAPETEPGPLAPTTDIPVGSGTIFTDQKVVVTQPSEGEFQGFSAVCTHSGCIVATITESTINCSCHGSKFSIVDGSVQGGPAPAPLPAVELSVEGGEIRIV